MSKAKKIANAQRRNEQYSQPEPPTLHIGYGSCTGCGRRQLVVAPVEPGLFEYLLDTRKDYGVDADVFRTATTGKCSVCATEFRTPCLEELERKTEAEIYYINEI